MDPAEIAASIQTILKYHESPEYLTEAELEKPHNPSSKVGNDPKFWARLEKSQYQHLQHIESINFGEQIITPMKKKKKKGLDPHSKEKELTRTYLDPFSKDTPSMEKTLKKSHYLIQDPHSKQIEMSRTTLDPFLKDPHSLQKELTGTYLDQFSKDTHLMGKPLTLGSSCPLLKDDLHEQECTEKYDNPWSKDRYLKDKDLPGTQDFPSPQDLHPKGKELTEPYQKQLAKRPGYRM